MRGIGAVLLALTLLTTGCIGLSAEAPADAQRGQADERARAWQDDAVLIRVMGAELANGTEVAAGEDFDEDPSVRALAAYDDETVGDGRAPAWLYVYWSAAADQSRGWVLEDRGDVAWEGVLDEDGRPIRDWRIDSTEAVAIAKENHERWAAVSNDDRAAEILVGTSGDPIWLLLVQGHDDEVMVMVNATDGTYLGEFDITYPAFDFSWDFGPIFIGEESGMEDGTLTAQNQMAIHAFALELEGHDTLYVTLRLFAPPPVTSVMLMVAGPTDALTGSATAVGTDLMPDGHAYAQVELPDPQPGSYEIMLMGENVVVQRYEVAWCAPGFDIDVDVAPSPIAWDPCGER